MQIGDDIIQRLVNIEKTLYGLDSQPPANPPMCIITGGVASPGAPALSVQGASADGLSLVGIPNSSFDPTTGDVTLGDNTYGFPVLKLGVYSTDGIGLIDSSAIGIGIYESLGTGAIVIGANGIGGITLDATTIPGDSGGTGPISLTSAGGISLTDNSAGGSALTQNGTGGWAIYDNGGGSTSDSGYALFLTTQPPANGNIGFISAGNFFIASQGSGGLTLNSHYGFGQGPLILDAGANPLTLTGVGTLNGNPILAALVGTTSSIGGSPLTLGQQATGTASITGASAAVAAGAVIQATPVSDPGDGFTWTASLTGTDNVTVKVICLVAGTPASVVYNVKIF